MSSLKEDLCERCLNIPWRDLASRPPPGKSAREVASLTSQDVETLARSPCRVCQLLARIVPRRPRAKPYVFAAWSSFLALMGRVVPPGEEKLDSDCTILFPVPQDKWASLNASRRGHGLAQEWHEADCLALTRARNDGNEEWPTIGPRDISSTAIDYDLIRGWLGDCNLDHRQPCKTGGGGSDSVRGLRLIDCYSRTVRVIDAPPRCTYVALSYVWGRPAQSDGPDDYPRTVADAITVTLALRQRYLWVDKYCIDQTSGPIKAAQIAQMDKIYSQAYITLTAAAGQDPSYGLPGVSTRPRHPQGHLLINTNNKNNNTISLTQIPPHACSDLALSRWSTRGWTYQEGYLSPRRLIFTDHQVSFLCNTSHRAESVRLPPGRDIPEYQDGADMDRFRGVIPTASGFSRAGGTDPWETLKRWQLVDYTARELTVAAMRKKVNSRLEVALAWHHHSKKVGAKRREMFPSWSWAGWEGGICMDAPDVCVPEDCEMELVNGGDGAAMPLQDWYDRVVLDPGLDSSNVPRVLRIKALTVRLEIRQISWGGLRTDPDKKARLDGLNLVDGPHAVFLVQGGITAMAYAYFDEAVPLDSGVLGLVLPSKDAASRESHAVLLLRPGGQHHQRAGLVRVSSRRVTSGPTYGEGDPHVVYLDGDDMPLEQSEQLALGEAGPLWLQKAVERTISVV